MLNLRSISIDRDQLRYCSLSRLYEKGQNQKHMLFIIYDAYDDIPAD